ncbi:multiple epidermal growth factor-like domains protein 11, partial [Biomphalaria pfeifferi]
IVRDELSQSSYFGIGFGSCGALTVVVLTVICVVYIRRKRDIQKNPIPNKRPGYDTVNIEHIKSDIHNYENISCEQNIYTSQYETITVTVSK